MAPASEIQAVRYFPNVIYIARLYTYNIMGELTWFEYFNIYVKNSSFTCYGPTCCSIRIVIKVTSQKQQCTPWQYFNLDTLFVATNVV